MRLSSFGRNPARSCAQCPRMKIHHVQQKRFSSSKQTATFFNRYQKIRVAQLAAASGTLAASAVFLSDEIKHGYNAAARSARVMSTLAVCVNE